jgi:hypothetical protein
LALFLKCQETNIYPRTGVQLGTLRTNSFTMPREVEPSLNEKQFVLQALEENVRTDGRPFDQFRPLELTFGDEYGVSNVRLGNTR